MKISRNSLVGAELGLPVRCCVRDLWRQTCEGQAFKGVGLYFAAGTGFVVDITDGAPLKTTAAVTAGGGGALGERALPCGAYHGAARPESAPYLAVVGRADAGFVVKYTAWAS